MSDDNRSTPIRDDFDEFEVDMTDVREFIVDSPNPAPESLWVSGLRRIAQQQIDSEQADLKRVQEMKH